MIQGGVFNTFDCEVVNESCIIHGLTVTISSCKGGISAPYHAMLFHCVTHKNLFPNFYIINLPSIIGIQFIDGVGENIVNCLFLYNSIGTDIMLHLHHLVIVSQLW